MSRAKQAEAHFQRLLPVALVGQTVYGMEVVGA